MFKSSLNPRVVGLLVVGVVAVWLDGCSERNAAVVVPMRPDIAGTHRDAGPNAEPRAGQLLEETSVETTSGATFRAPAGFWLTRAPHVIVLETPDRQLKATLLETSERDAGTAIASSWRQVRRLVVPPQRRFDSPPPVRGWEVVVEVEYEAQTTDEVVAATARRFGGVTYVALLEGTKQSVARRRVELDAALWTLEPKGMHEESFRDRNERVFDDRAAAELEVFIETARMKLDVPGTAVAVLQGREVVFAKGFGVLTLGKGETVTRRSLFMIGSITKSMTTMMQASLIDAGLLGWNTLVTKALPSFTLGSSELTSQLTLAHTSCACSGVPRRDLETVFEFASVTPEQALARTRTLQPTTGFGETFQYSSELVAAGGYAAGHAFRPHETLGQAYDAAMRSRVFEPIGMKSSTLDFAAASRAEHALPHSEGIDGMPRPIPLALERYVLPLRPSGGVWSNIDDLSSYALTEMSGGIAPNGKRVVSETNLLERRKPRVRIGDVESYGLGLVVGTFRDLSVFWHSGQTAGFAGLMHVLPERRIGVIVLTNSHHGGPLCQVIQRKVAEQLFDGKDLAGPRLEFFARRKRETVARALKQTRLVPDPALLKRLVGSYSNPRLGPVRIIARAKAAIIDAGEWQSALGQRSEADGTVKLIPLDPPAAGFVDFVVAGDELHPKLSVSLEQETFVFERERSGP